MTIAIIDYGSGNLHSASKAFERAGREAGLSDKVVVTADPEVVRKADRVVLPGVGAFADCYSGLMAVEGMFEALSEAVLTKGQPFFGICVGMQLLATKGLEHGEQMGFDWISGKVQALTPSDPNLKIPHMGWNELRFGTVHPVFADLPGEAHTYFVHSYHFDCDDPSMVLSTVDYGGTVTAAVGRDNIIGTQFHPEKSQGVGLKVITNFLTWRP
ncbi:MAG: imidazole glycerol phosphate synthase subunit HisH [Rhodospirillales bacterium]|nr:imidazole glycerol phosphate synthase subunit HisH [Rhodospirillales bacterium]